MLEFDSVRQLLPQGHPFVFVDRVLECVPGERIVCLKNVTGSEPFFAGHFREFAVMPGAITGEALAQSAILLFRLSQEGAEAERDDDRIFVVGTTRTRFLEPVFPGDALHLEVRFEKRLSASAMVRGEGKVDGRSVIRSSLTLAVRSLSEIRAERARRFEQALREREEARS